MKNSIKKNKEFKEIYEKNNSFATKSLVMFISKNSDTERNRLGISVSHKVGNSVVRHLLIRRMREIFRKNEEKIKNGYDIIVVFRIGSDKKEFQIIEKDFIYVCKKHGILKEEHFG